MDSQALLRALDEERLLAERDLAVGDWDRARRRTGEVLEDLQAYLKSMEPELHAWVRLLGTLAGAERCPARDGQLALWPEIEARACRYASRDDQKSAELASFARSNTLFPGGRRGAVPGSMMSVITRDPQLLRTLALLEQLAPTDLPVLLEGESGTGKEIVAHGIHTLSARSEQPFIAVNCGAIPAELHESELFGHTRGAYTGATVEKQGLFEAAHKGTLFLDEIGEMEPRAQAKLLRVLETGELRRLGEVRMRSVDVRIISATNQDVDRAIDSGRFRSDLLFRIGAMRASLPPLRERPGDILPLATHFLRKALARPPLLTPGARHALFAHDWPGNVRELKYVMERAAALWRQSGEAFITREVLLLDARAMQAATRSGTGAAGVRSDRVSRDDSVPSGNSVSGGSDEGGPETSRANCDELPAGWTLERYLGEIEKRLIEGALARAGWNRTAAARALGGMSRTTLIGKMKRFGLGAVVNQA